MTHHDTRIVEYMRRFPEVRTQYVANIFGVEMSHVSTLRSRHGCYGTRKKAAIERRLSVEELDKQILAAVYKRGLVDTVLQG